MFGGLSRFFLASLTTCISSLWLAALPVRADQSKVWQALLSGGHVALIRHAVAPGTGDPSGFRIGDCSTQRNLSTEGRAQAGRIGDLFRRNGIARADVYTSQWCRCRDTAQLLKLGTPAALPVLNSFFGAWRNSGPQTKELRAWLRNRSKPGPAVLVTHQVNITELTGVYPASGEIVVISMSQAGEVTVTGTIRTD
jgi:phosphohistidine phosphatase SixA